jgi:hypothetical protein
MYRRHDREEKICSAPIPTSVTTGATVEDSLDSLDSLEGS